MSNLPAAIVNEKRSNVPFLSRLALLIAAMGLYAYAAPQGALGATFGVAVMLLAFAALVHWAYTETMKNKALMESLSQSELVSMLGRHGETWRSTESVVRELDRRYPAWREGASAAWKETRMSTTPLRGQGRILERSQADFSPLTRGV